jgi:hypothetical protein
MSEVPLYDSHLNASRGVVWCNVPLPVAPTRGAFTGIPRPEETDPHNDMV